MWVLNLAQDVTPRRGLDRRIPTAAGLLGRRNHATGMLANIPNVDEPRKKVARDLVPASVLQRPKQPYRAPDSKSFFGDAANRQHEPWVLDGLRSLHHPLRAGSSEASALCNSAFTSATLFSFGIAYRSGRRATRSGNPRTTSIAINRRKSRDGVAKSSHAPVVSKIAAPSGHDDARQALGELRRIVDALWIGVRRELIRRQARLLKPKQITRATHIGNRQT